MILQIITIFLNLHIYKIDVEPLGLVCIFTCTCFKALVKLMAPPLVRNNSEKYVYMLKLV